MDLKLKNITIAVAGSSRGIGKGIVKNLLNEGANTVVTGRNRDSVKNTFEEFNNLFPDNICYHVGDLNEGSILDGLKNKLLDKWERIDGIVCNVGGSKPIDENNIKNSDWDWFAKANFGTSVKFTEYFCSELKKVNGAIVYISSIAGIEELGAPIPYNVYKAALNVYAKNQATRLAKWGIRVNVVAPGNIFFKGGSWDLKLKENPRKIKKIIKDNVPLNKFGDPDDIANIVTFLLSEKAKFVTGSCIIADGGQTKRYY